MCVAYLRLSGVLPGAVSSDMAPSLFQVREEVTSQVEASRKPVGLGTHRFIRALANMPQEAAIAP